MKFLIDNYAEYDNSQALYFSQHISQSDEHDSIFLSQQNMSLFDTFDKTKPDFYITSASHLSRDAVLYLSENKNVRLLLSVSGTKNNEVIEIEKILLQNKVNCPFFFSDLGDSDLPFTKKIKTIRILNGYDENFELDNPELKFNVDKCVIALNSPEIRNYNSTFHVVTTNSKLSKDVDLFLPINWLSQLLANYQEIIFSDLGDSLPQIFFQALSCGKRVYYDIKNETKSEKASKIIDGIFGVGDSLNYKNSEKMLDFSDIRQTVLEKHSSSRRTKTLLSQIPKK